MPRGARGGGAQPGNDVGASETQDEVHRIVDRILGEAGADRADIGFAIHLKPARFSFSRIAIGLEGEDDTSMYRPIGIPREDVLASAETFARAASALLRRERAVTPWREETGLAADPSWAVLVQRPALHMLRWCGLGLDDPYEANHVVHMWGIGFQPTLLTAASTTLGLSGGFLRADKIVTPGGDEPTLRYQDKNGPMLRLGGMQIPDTMRMAASGMPLSMVLDHPAFEECGTPVRRVENTSFGGIEIHLDSDHVLGAEAPEGTDMSWIEALTGRPQTDVDRHDPPIRERSDG